MNIYHIISESDWEKAKNHEKYFPSNYKTEGYIHCSKIKQFVRVANVKFKNKKNLLLLEIEMEKVKSPIKFEKLLGTKEKHPHIYGGLNIDAVKNVYKLTQDADGFFVQPIGIKLRQ